MFSEYNFFVLGGSTAENSFLLQTSKTTYNTQNKFEGQCLNICLFSQMNPSFHVIWLQKFDPYENNIVRNYTLPACLNNALNVS